MKYIYVLSLCVIIVLVFMNIEGKNSQSIYDMKFDSYGVPIYFVDTEDIRTMPSSGIELIQDFSNVSRQEQSGQILTSEVKGNIVWKKLE